jgi:alpha-1,4-N-acetylglucosaminyltransferase EXTL3
MIYHRKWLEEYSYRLPSAARQLVDDRMNCDDLLFNYMVANKTNRGPTRRARLGA